MNDLVSIVMPSYNTASYIKDSIESVLNQTYTNWELIIVDDCSTDNTDEVVTSIHDGRIRYLKNEKNSGAAVSRNRALRVAKGRWIAFLDSDDLWMPEKLEKQIRFMESNGYAFSYTNYEEIDEMSNNMGIVVTGPRKITRIGMQNYCWPGCLTVMYDTNTIGGGISVADIKKNNDYAMWLQVSRKADCYLLDEVLAKYRKRSGSISNHSYLKLVIWHYKLFHEAEGYNPLISAVLTIKNLFFGIWKKVRYVKR